MESKFDELQFSTLINSFPGVVYKSLTDNDWPLIFISTGIQELAGYQVEHFFGNNPLRFGDLILPEFKDMVWLGVHDALANHEAFQLEYKIQTADGKEKWVFEQGHGNFDEFGNLLSIEGFVSDISQKKSAEEALRESEAKYKTLTELGSVGVWQANEDMRTIYVNQAMCDILGVESAKTMSGKPMDSFFTPDCLEIVKRNYQSLKANIQSITFKAEIVRKDGEIRNIQVYAAPLFDKNGGFDSVIGKFVDSTNQENINKSLIRSEESLRKLFEDNPLPQAITRKGEIIKVNRALARVLDFSDPQELIGRNVIDFIHPAHRDLVKDSIIQRWQEGDSPTSYDLIGIKKGGEEFHIHVDLGFLELSDGKATIIHVEDVTEAKTAEIQLRDSEAKFKVLFESELMGIAISSADGSIIEANLAFFKMLGYSKQDIDNGLTWDDITPEEYRQREEESLKEIVETGIIRPFEKEYYRKDGSKVSAIVGASLLGSSIMGSEAKGVSFMIDISELKKSQKQLEAINKELNTFLYMASHDLKGPLASVVGLAQIAREETNDPLVINYLNLIIQSTSKLDKSLMNLMRIMKIKEGAPQPENIDFHNLIEGIKDNLKKIEGFDEVDISFKINIQEDFRSEPGILNSILQNLMENSIKYRSSLHGSSFVFITVCEMNNNVVIEIEDNGKGVDPKIKNRVFDMFYRGTTESKGSGLGLYIVKTAVEKINGKIEVRERQNGGTIFTMVFPKS